MIATLRLKIAILVNRFRRRKGPTLADQCAKVIMHTCTLQLERTETRELAPTPGALGKMLLAGGAITSVTYQVFDTDADKVDKGIRLEPWRAFATIIMRISLQSAPEFQVLVDSAEVTPRACHKAPGLELVKQLSQYFPLLPRPHTGPVIKPVIDEAV